MHLIPFKGRNISETFDLNLLFQNGKSFIMDNHLAASWCWAQQIDLHEQYNFFHIDRHYDLSNHLMEDWITKLNESNFDFGTISIDDFLAIKFERADIPAADSYPLFKWDNYIAIFRELYPELLNTVFFATHKVGEKIEEFVMTEPPIYDMPMNLSHWIKNEKRNQWIVNLDIDYFFSEYNEEVYQILTDDYVLKIADELKDAWDKIAVFTIALSPEMCGGWEQSIRVARLITDRLEIEWSEQ